MRSFEDIKSEWNKQIVPEIPSGGADRIANKIRKIKIKQRIAYIVLSLTLVILLIFFFHVSAYRSTTTMIALFLMMAPLLVRIVLEVCSIRALKQLNVVLQTQDFKKGMLRYYIRRRWVHFLITPLAFGIYTIGFTMLLPGFKTTFSKGFYLYIIISSIVSLSALALLIVVQIIKEQDTLRSLKDSKT
ncbi:MAG: hypothetical protein AAGB24_02715 [Bacteroidota bacterium]